VNPGRQTVQGSDPTKIDQERSDDSIPTVLDCNPFVIFSVRALETTHWTFNEIASKRDTAALLRFLLEAEGATRAEETEEGTEKK
jgi:hypothetical protein